MTRRQYTPWLRTPCQTYNWEGSELVEVDPRYVPMLLSDMEARKTDKLWLPDGDFETAYDAICKQQVALLMGATEYLARVLFFQMGYPRDVQLAEDRFPLVELPEATLIAIRSRIGDPLDPTVIAKLEELRLALEAAGLDQEEVIGLLTQIAAFLAV